MFYLIQTVTESTLLARAPRQQRDCCVLTMLRTATDRMRVRHLNLQQEKWDPSLAARAPRSSTRHVLAQRRAPAGYRALALPIVLPCLSPGGRVVVHHSRMKEQGGRCHLRCTRNCRRSALCAPEVTDSGSCDPTKSNCNRCNASDYDALMRSFETCLSVATIGTCRLRIIAM